MYTKAECEHCAYATPKDNDEVARKSINDWKFPDDWECSFQNDDFYPDGAHFCPDWFDNRKIEVISS